MLPLVLIQLFFCWGTYAVCNWIASLAIGSRSKDDTIGQLKRQILEVASQVPKAQANALHEAVASKPSTLTIVSGAEHYNVLKRALSEATTRICILSGWIGSPILDAEIRHLIHNAVTRGVHMYFGFGWESSAGHQVSDTAQQAISYIRSLGRNAVTLAQFPNHEKLLIVDAAYCVIGSNNWLSNAAFRNSERSILVRNARLAFDEGERIQGLVERNRM
jgi:phosphatidylserine/phosphatidylglycerophosphate/cardiolipin synthase-like enzyme